MSTLAACPAITEGDVARVQARAYAADEKADAAGLLLAGKVRAVPVVNVVLLGRLEAVGDAWAFPNRLGGHLSPGHVSKLLSGAMPPRWTGHTLRHRMATTAYHSTRDLLAVQQVLGHARPETTQRYVLTPDEAIRAAVRAAS